jgi:hypothetical protein
MSTNEVRTNDAAESASVSTVDMKLEVVVIPVSDVDRAKEFYSRLGWRLDADRSADDNFRLVQFTTPVHEGIELWKKARADVPLCASCPIPESAWSDGRSASELS